MLLLKYVKILFLFIYFFVPGTQSLALCDSFAITDTMLSAPIALDWVKYNTYDNQGELMTKEEWDTHVRSKK